MPCGDRRTVHTPPHEAVAQARAAPAREEPGILTGPEMAGIANDSGLRVAPPSNTADAPR
ncbi:hypothetical protein ACQCSU_09920 [Pseudarthrobacter sp. O4]|uniref:hypothetical protein n=1 Tax=Pseudarthrobacter sp. O4 TaxID=3418417 RepID=UPI003CEFE712